MAEEAEVVTMKEIATKTINSSLTIRDLASRVVAEAAVATAANTKRMKLASTLIIARSSRSMTRSIKVVAIKEGQAKAAALPLIRELMSNTIAKISNMMRLINRSQLVAGKITLVKVENTTLRKVSNTTMIRASKSLREIRSLPKHLREERDLRLAGNMLLAMKIKRLLMLLWVPKYCKSSKSFSSRPPRLQQVAKVVARKNHRTCLTSSGKIIIIDTLFQ